MIPVFTAVHERKDILPAWLNALSATLKEDFVPNVFHTSDECPTENVVCKRIPHYGMTVSYIAFHYLMPQDGIRVFLEEDIIPVRPWSLSEYQGDFLFLEGSPNKAWPGIAIGRAANFSGKFGLVSQKPARVFGCPSWAGSELCDLALAADARFVGNHFVHLDKMSRQPPPKEIEAKNRLLHYLQGLFDAATPRPGLGDMVAAGLSAVGITKERVSKMLGKPCGCAKRQAKLNDLGRRLGIG